MSKAITNAADLEWQELGHEDKFYHRRKNLTQGLTDNKMMVVMYEIPPGKTNWPYHYHCANEEIYYILEGEGELRHNGEIHQLKAGDLVRFKTGPEGAHQLKNNSDKVLRYLDIDSTNDPDIAVYPDSNKIAVIAGGSPGQNKPRYLFKVLDLGAEKGYWDGE